MANPLYGQNKFDNSVGEKLYSEAGTLREHENTVTAADLFSYQIPANKLEVGDIVRIKAFCTVVDSNSTDTLTPILNFAGSAIATGAALDVVDSDIVYVWADVHVTSSTAMTAVSEIRTDALGATTVIAATNLSSKDITAVMAVALNVDWSVAHADNEVRIDSVSIELV
jgi:hypothetical protein|tara:strand:- start:818 stop:1324 length:507 start_codon:yes stop_codon:yes gene_type:complete